MSNKVKPIPDGYHTVTPYLTVAGASKLIDFLKRTFDAKEVERMERPLLEHSRSDAFDLEEYIRLRAAAKVRIRE